MNFRSLDFRSDSGQTMTEMGVILALVVLIVMVAVAAYGTRLGTLWATLSSTLPGGG